MTLTKEQIQQMEAGYPMDILIATEIMGYRWMAYTRYPGEYVRFLVPGSTVEALSKDYEVWTEGVSPEARMMEARHVLPYSPSPIDFSTNIAAAFHVVERLQAKLGMTSTVFEMRYMNCGSMITSNAGILGNSVDMQWTAAFAFDAPVKAATAPLVICRAALIHKLGL